MHYRYKLLSLIIFLLSGLTTAAQPVITFGSDQGDIYIGKSLVTFQDSTSRLGLNDVQKLNHLFVPGQKSVPDFGVTGHNNWVRLRVVNTTERKTVILTLSYPPIDKVTLYEVRPNASKQADTQYVLQPSHKHEFYIFNLDAPKGDTITCYLKLRSNKQLIVPLTLGTTQDMLQDLTQTDAFSGLYLGIMIVMILYNLFIYFSARDKQYLYYVNYIFWVMLTQAALLGYIHRFFSLERDSWIGQNLFTFFGAMSGIGTIMFVKYFLGTKIHTPRSNVVLTFIMFADIIAIILLFAGLPVVSYMVVNVIAALGAISIFVTAILVYRKNRKPAFFFLVAWNVFLFSVLVFVLKDFDVFPYNFFTVHSVQIGSALEAILLSFALADRINILKKEKDQSRLTALRIAKENSRIIKEQNVLLEIKVKERTEELIHKNEELNTTLEDLQEAQMQLVESEKMASLGQLTAGIAHEINNPINFVTGNIGPLKRDVEILFHTINLLEDLNTQNISDEEKVKKAEAYKEEQDFDYLKIEISHLLKGINEGASRTAEIVKSLRIFSRLDEDDLKLADMNEGLESTITIVNNLLSKIKVTKHLNKLPLVNCYPGKLNQVFLNIISNGLFAIEQKFGEAEGGELTVETALSGENVIIKITDNGTGMTEQTKHKIFEPFFTTKDVGQGTGLGMSIAFNTIQKHNGSINVDTKPGEGSTFTLTIPVNEMK
jgi:two-component system NtrC family sensor kinase